MLICGSACAQRMFFNSGDIVYEFTGAPVTCATNNLGHFCVPDTGNLSSLACHGDTLYIVTSQSELYQVVLGSPSSCRDMTNISIPGGPLTGITAMTCDKNGLVYAVDATSLDLYRYDPHTNILDILGALPTYPDGDMLFYQDTLLIAAGGFSIWWIDLAQPSASQPFMATPGFGFESLLELPGDCLRNTFYGLTGNQLVAFDPYTRTLLGPVCTATFNGLDGASTVEDGTVPGPIFYTLAVPAVCGGASAGSIQAFASAATEQSATYTLDGSLTNSTGVFSNVAVGTHSMHFQISPTCFVDTVFMLKKGLSPAAYQIANPQDCANVDGSIAITASSGLPPVLFSLDSAAAQTSPLFDHLGPGQYTLVITDSGGCEEDTTVVLAFQHILGFPGAITIDSPVCVPNNAGIGLVPNGVIPASMLTVSLNGGSFQQALTFPGLTSGVYDLRVAGTDGCSWDTVLTIPPYPIDSVTLSIDPVNPICTALNSGALKITVQGGQGPYSVAFNNMSFANGATFDHLGPGAYTLLVINKDGCVVDTVHTYLRLDATPQCDQVYIPNAFTPGRGGDNSLFRVIHSPYITQVRLRVYNRYGTLIFTSTDVQPGWDGSFNGAQQPAGTYVWTVEYTNLENLAKRAEGTVILIR